MNCQRLVACRLILAHASLTRSSFTIIWTSIWTGIQSAHSSAIIKTSVRSQISPNDIQAASLTGGRRGRQSDEIQAEANELVIMLSLPVFTRDWNIDED